MSKKKLNRNTRNKKEHLSAVIKVTGSCMRVLTSCYVIALFIALPLLYHNRYYDIGEFKFALYERFTWILVIGVGLAGIVHLTAYCIQEQRTGRLLASVRTLPGRMSVADWVALSYAAVVLHCYFLSSYRADALEGYKGWHMGLLSQLSFVLLYFLVSRYWIKEWLKGFLRIAGAASAAVYLIAILHRFRIDPLRLYEGLEEYYFVQFLSTIGQATWYSAFLCTVLPVGLLLFWYCDERCQRICLGIYCALGYASLVTQNSDSAFAALITMWAVLFFMSFDSNKAFRRFLEVVILGIGTMRVIGLLQMLYADRMIPLESLSLFWSQNIGLWFVLALLITVYIILLWGEAQYGLDIESLDWIRKAVAALLGAGVILVIGLMVLVTRGWLPRFLQPLYEVSYFVFDDRWGNQRGFTWTLSAQMFLEYPLKEKLIGIGPDCYAHYLYDHYADRATEVFGSSVLANAHNEWLNILLNEGLLGLAAYLGFFLSAAVTFIKNRGGHIMTAAAAVCIFSYIIHNLFCYQQVMCTPVIFILIGMGVRYLAIDQDWMTVNISCELP